MPSGLNNEFSMEIRQCFKFIPMVVNSLKFEVKWRVMFSLFSLICDMFPNQENCQNNLFDQGAMEYEFNIH